MAGSWRYSRPPACPATIRTSPRTDHERPGRLYVGYLAPRLDRQHCLAPLAAALLMGPLAVFEDGEDREALLEAWWTHVIYHGSLRGVGNSHNAYSIDVRDFGAETVPRMAASPGVRAMAALPSRLHERSQPVTGTPKRRRRTSAYRGLTFHRIRQLTSIFRAEENAETFRRLARRRGEEGHLDAGLATNMVSVGLDVAPASP